MDEETELKVLRVAVVTNVLSHYRDEFYRLLFRRDDLDVTVYCQASIPGENLKLIHGQFPDRVTLVPTGCLRNELLAWQRLPWRRLLSSFDVVFVDGRPRVVSNVVLSVLAKALGRPTVLCGQAHSAGAGALTERLRLWWWRRFQNLFVYTDHEARWLRDHRGFRRHHVVGMNNGLDQRRIDEAAAAWDDRRLAAWRERQGVAGRTQVLSCTRLGPKNRFDLWLEAMPAVIFRHPDLSWCVIGDGPERPSLEAQARKLGIESNVRWLGQILEEEELAPWFVSSRLLVHPAAIGLTLFHAFGYGLPVITHDDRATQGPEFAAFVEGETGLLYRGADVASLADAVCRCLADEAARCRMGTRARQIAREDYNVHVMAERFVAMAKRAGAGR